MEQFKINLVVYPLVATHAARASTDTLSGCAPDSQQFLRNCKPIDHTKALYAICVVDGSMIYKVLDYEMIRLRVSFEFEQAPYIFVKEVSTFYPVLTLKYALALDMQRKFNVAVMPTQIVLTAAQEQLRDDLILACYGVTEKSVIEMQFCRQRTQKIALVDAQNGLSFEVDVFSRQAVKGVARELKSQLCVENARIFVNFVPLNDDEIITNYVGKRLSVIRLGDQRNRRKLQLLDGSKRIELDCDMAQTVREVKQVISDLINVCPPKIAFELGSTYFEDEKMMLCYKDDLDATIIIRRRSQPQTVCFTIMSHSINSEEWYVNADWTVAEVKERFSEETGIASERCCCLHEGRVLDDVVTLAQAEVRKNSTLVFCFRVVDDVRQLAYQVNANFQDAGKAGKQLIYEYGVRHHGTP